MALRTKDVIDTLKDPFGLNSTQWGQWKAGYAGWKKSQLAGLAAQERNAREQYADFTSQARSQLTNAVGQLKTSVGNNALARGIERSTIPGTVIGSETDRMNQQYQKQDEAAQTQLAQTVKAVSASRKNLANLNQSVNNIDSVFSSDEAPILYDIASGNYTATSRINDMEMEGASDDYIAPLSVKLNSAQTLVDNYKTENDPLIQSYVKGIQGLSDGDYDKTKAPRTLGDYLYWQGFAGFNGLANTLKLDSAIQTYKAAKASSGNTAPAAEATGSGQQTSQTSSADDSFDLPGAIKSNGLLDASGNFDWKKTTAYEGKANDEIQKETVDLLGIKLDPNDKDAFSKLKLMQAGWDSQGYHYDMNDPDDVLRKELKLAPGSFLKLYDDTPEDQENLKNGKSPKFLNDLDQALGAIQPNWTPEQMQDYINSTPILHQMQATADINAQVSAEGGPNASSFSGANGNHYAYSALSKLGYDKDTGWQSLIDRQTKLQKQQNTINDLGQILITNPQSLIENTNSEEYRKSLEALDIDPDKVCDAAKEAVGQQDKIESDIFTGYNAGFTNYASKKLTPTGFPDMTQDKALKYVQQGYTFAEINALTGEPLTSAPGSMTDANGQPVSQDELANNLTAWESALGLSSDEIKTLKQQAYDKAFNLQPGQVRSFYPGVHDNDKYFSVDEILKMDDLGLTDSEKKQLQFFGVSFMAHHGTDSSGTSEDSGFSLPLNALNILKKKYIAKYGHLPPDDTDNVSWMTIDPAYNNTGSVLTERAINILLPGSLDLYGRILAPTGYEAMNRINAIHPVASSAGDIIGMIAPMGALESGAGFILKGGAKAAARAGEEAALETGGKALLEGGIKSAGEAGADFVFKGIAPALEEAHPLLFEGTKGAMSFAAYNGISSVIAGEPASQVALHMLEGGVQGFAFNVAGSVVFKGAKRAWDSLTEGEKAGVLTEALQKAADDPAVVKALESDRTALQDAVKEGKRTQAESLPKVADEQGLTEGQIPLASKDINPEGSLPDAVRNLKEGKTFETEANGEPALTIASPKIETPFKSETNIGDKLKGEQANIINSALQDRLAALGKTDLKSGTIVVTTRNGMLYSVDLLDKDTAGNLLANKPGVEARTYDFTKTGYGDKGSYSFSDNTLEARKQAQRWQTANSKEDKAGKEEEGTDDINQGIGETGQYTEKIEWGALDVDARPAGRGFFGTRTQQSNPRVNAYELKINPNNESYYLKHPDGRYVQFENMVNGSVKDGKLIMDPKSYYHVDDLPDFAKNGVLLKARRQAEAAGSAGYIVEWLVSDSKAVSQLTDLFRRYNIDIVVKYLPE